MSDTEQSTDESVAALPGDGLREGIVEELRRHLGDALVDIELRPQDDLWVRVRTDAWEQTGRAVHAMGFHYFCFLSALDWLPSPWGRGEDDPTEPPPERSTAIVQGVAGGDTRFQVLARVVDVRRHVGVTLKVDVPDDTMAVASWHAVYAGADWHERETHEMFGIGFDGHPDLRNMYLPTDFEGHPLRKDFPLLARMVKPWPGIVDVEPMPAEDEEDEEAPKTEEAPEAGEMASADATDPSSNTEDEFASDVEPDSGQESHTNPSDSIDDEAEAAEGSASDEADAARGQSEAAAEPAAEGSASDEADAARDQSEAATASDDETEAAEGSASDEADAARDQSEAAAEPAAGEHPS